MPVTKDDLYTPVIFDTWLIVLWCSNDVVHLHVLVHFKESAVYVVIISSDGS